MKKGKLIALAGIDGSGKTTQAELLVNELKKSDSDVIYVWSRWEPKLLRFIIQKWKRNVASGTNDTVQEHDSLKVGKKRLLDNPILRFLWISLFFFDYGLQIFVKIRLKLIMRKTIISDRIFYDSIIDQALNLGERKEKFLKSFESFWLRMIFPKPDMVIYVDCPADIAFARKDDAPNVEYLSDRRMLYLKLADRYGWKVVDGTLPVDEIEGRIKKMVLNRTGI